MPKLSIKIVKDRLSLDGRGIKMLGSYKGGHTKTMFECREGHRWEAQPNSVFSGTGCPQCAGTTKIDISDVNDRLSVKGIRIIGTYINSNTKTEFECCNGHRWATLPTLVMNGTGCPHCAGVVKYTTESFNGRLTNRGLRLVGEYINAKTPVLFRCDHGHEWTAKPTNVLSGKGCPSCAEYGFNPDHPACFYTIHIFSDAKEYVGFGITKDKVTRFSYHARAIKKDGFDFKVMDTVEFESGHDARALEDLIKENMPLVDTGIKGFRKEAVPATAYLQMQRLMETLIS